VGAVFRGWAGGVDVSSYGENDGEGRSIMTGSRSGLGSRRSSFRQSKVNKLHPKRQHFFRGVGWTFCLRPRLILFLVQSTTQPSSRREREDDAQRERAAHSE
jgi:hypothetical protein